MHQRAIHQPEGHPDSELIEGLEPDQLVETSSLPLPQLRLSLTWNVFFWALRIFVLLITTLVIYVFVIGLPGAR